MEQTQTIGKRICAHRKRLGLTQDQLAEKVGVSAQAVSKWENDLSCPDISVLPLLAGIFGITTDELLGVESRQPPVPAEAERDEEPEGIHITADNDGKSWDFHIGPPRSGRLMFALWVIAIGGMMLLGWGLGVPVDFWDAVWTTGVTMWGLGGIVRRFSFPRALTVLAGLYFMAEELRLVDFELGWGGALPVLLVIFGVSLLVDSLSRKERGLHIRGGGSRAELRDGVLDYSVSFGDRTYRADADLLKGGLVQTSFADTCLDLGGVKELAPGCTLTVRCSFGDMRILVPKRFRVECAVAGSFGGVDVRGCCDEEPEGELRLEGGVSFGDLKVEYV